MRQKLTVVVGFSTEVQQFVDGCRPLFSVRIARLGTPTPDPMPSPHLVLRLRLPFCYLMHPDHLHHILIVAIEDKLTLYIGGIDIF